MEPEQEARMKVKSQTMMSTRWKIDCHKQQFVVCLEMIEICGSVEREVSEERTKAQLIWLVTYRLAVPWYFASLFVRG
jgi:hypothetical protein